MGETAIRLLIPSAPSAAELLPYLEKIDASRWYSNSGPLNRELETQLRGCTISSATLGLQLALQTLKTPRKPRVTVLVPSFTYPATICAIVNAGCVPVFCDVDPRTWSMNEHIASDANDIDIVLPVCAFGIGLQWPLSWPGPLVLDAAAAFFNQAPPEKHPAVFSLHATKYPGAGEGGFVTGPSDQIAKVRRLAAFGFNDRRTILQSGTNAKLSEYHAAVALASMEHIGEYHAKLTALGARYYRAIESYCGALRTQENAASLHVPTSMNVLLPTGIDTEETAEFMGMRGIETRRWYWPLCHLMPAFKHFPLAANLKVSRDISERLLGLPFHLYLNADDINRVCSTLKDAIQNQKAKQSCLSSH